MRFLDLIRQCCPIACSCKHCNWAHGVVVSHPLSMREALGSIPSVSTFESDAFSSAANTSPHMDYCSTRRASDSVSEWLRRWTRNPLGSARRGSNPLGVVLLPLLLPVNAVAQAIARPSSSTIAATPHHTNPRKKSQRQSALLEHPC